MQSRIVIVAAALIIGVLVAPAGLVGAAPVAEAQDFDCEFPMTVTDATGTDVTLDDPPERIVTTSPSAAQTMWEFGAEEKVVGLTQYALYLEGAEDREVISGEEDAVIVERVIDLEPDLVLAPNTTDPNKIDQLRDAGVTVYHFSAEKTMDDVIAHTILTGELVGECDAAADTVGWMQERLSVVEEAVSGQERPTALYAFFGWTAGEGTFIHEIIEFAGAENVAATADIQGYQQISEEVVIDQDPDWMILNSDDPGLPESEAFNQTTAVQEGQIVIVPIEQLNQPAPRTVHAITTLAEHFHPDAFATANETAADADDTAEITADDPDDSEAEALPGFGAVVALIALLIGATGMSRRA